MIPALEESVAGLDRVRVLHADATDRRVAGRLGEGDWVLAANLPYNVATHLVLDTLRDVPQVRRLVVMVQREVGERLVAGPGEKAYGIPSVRVAYRADGDPRAPRAAGRLLAAPEGGVRHRASPAAGTSRAVTVDEDRLWAVVDAGFAERRKTMRNALRRLGVETGDADALLEAAEVDPSARAETLSIEEFARIAEAPALSGAHVPRAHDMTALT